MTTQPFIRILQGRLNEVYFVFRQLPKQLNSAAKRLGMHHLRDRVKARAEALMRRADELACAMRNWGGRKPAPCTCEDLSAELNDLRHAVKSAPPERWLATTTLRISNKLASMVRDRLEEARRIASQLNEPVLAAQIDDLLENERRADDELAGVPSSD